MAIFNTATSVLFPGITQIPDYKDLIAIPLEQRELPRDSTHIFVVITTIIIFIITITTVSSILLGKRFPTLQQGTLSYIFITFQHLLMSTLKDILIMRKFYAWD